ncbi:hypothetical protein Vretimale_12618, partial [Volvox reticuliferus]
MMTTMFTSLMFLQQIAMALQQVPQAQTTFVPATEQPEASAVQQAGPSSPPQPAPPPDPTPVNAPTREQSRNKMQWTSSSPACIGNGVIQSKILILAVKTCNLKPLQIKITLPSKFHRPLCHHLQHHCLSPLQHLTP